MLTNASETLVKDTKTSKLYIENNVIYIFKTSITQVSKLFYRIWFVN
jgi:hypothetical protein